MMTTGLHYVKWESNFDFYCVHILLDFPLNFAWITWKGLNLIIITAEQRTWANMRSMTRHRLEFIGRRVTGTRVLFPYHSVKILWSCGLSEWSHLSILPFMALKWKWSCKREYTFGLRHQDTWDCVIYNSGGPLEKITTPNLELKDPRFCGKMSGLCAVSNDKEEWMWNLWLQLVC